MRGLHFILQLSFNWKLENWTLVCCYYSYKMFVFSFLTLVKPLSELQNALFSSPDELTHEVLLFFRINYQYF